MPWVETLILGILGCGLGLNGGFIPELCNTCRVLCASCLRLIGLLGRNTELNCPFRVFALSVSSVWVVSLAFSEIIPLESCFECFRSEYNFLVLTLGGASRSSSSLFNPKMSFTYFS